MYYSDCSFVGITCLWGNPVHPVAAHNETEEMQPVTSVS